MVTKTVIALGDGFLQQAVDAMVRSSAFNAENDPYDEHDFGSLDVSNERVFWKIDYYDQSLTRGADDPAEGGTCVRVLTLMMASDY